MTENTNGFVNVEQMNFDADFAGYFAEAEYTNTNVRSHTERQAKYISDLCRQKGQQQADVTGMTYDEASELIGKLLGMKGTDGMTPKQKAKIEEIIARNPHFNINEAHPNWSKYTKDEASTLIGWLFDMERESRHLKPCTEAQVAKIVRMYLCPDVIFSDTGWVETYEERDGKRYLVRPASRFLAQWIATNMRQQDASEFITKYNAKYLEWSRGRVTKQQQAFIRQLEQRMANLYSAGGAHEQKTDADGNVIANDGPSRKEWAPKGYEELDAVSLYIMSEQAASKYIEVLQAELQRKELTRFNPESMIGDYLEEKRITTGDESVEHDAKLMADFVYGLYAQLGEDLDEVARQHAETPTKRIGYDTIEFVRELIGRCITKGVSMTLITDMLDDVPEVKAEVYA